MKFQITIRKDGRLIASFPGIGNPFELHDAAIDEFGPCSVSIMERK